MLQEGKRLWFRGQSVAKYRLIPGVLRDAVAVTDWAGRDIKPQKVNFSGGKGEKCTLHKLLEYVTRVQK